MYTTLTLWQSHLACLSSSMATDMCITRTLWGKCEQAACILATKDEVSEVTEVTIVVMKFMVQYCLHIVLLDPQIIMSVQWSLSIDGFHSIFHHRNWRAKISCDVDID